MKTGVIGIPEGFPCETIVMGERRWIRNVSKESKESEKQCAQRRLKKSRHNDLTFEQNLYNEDGVK